MSVPIAKLPVAEPLYLQESNSYSLLRLLKMVKDIGMNEHDIRNVLELAKYNQLQYLQWRVVCLRYEINMLELEKSKRRKRIGG